MSEQQQEKRANRLAQETSPYLLQHAYNPVDWYPWGPEALGLAKERNKPLLLSIGYSACHWCHVMEHESFEDERIAALMNEHFVCIKVDREERPDLDEIYMQATLALNQGQGGWPMTVFLTPDREPMFAGTYFPPTDRWGRPGFATVLQKVAEFWRTDPQGMRQQAARLTERIRADMSAVSPTSVGETELDAVVAQYAEEFDPQFGGFGTAPKFPPATALSLLLRCHHRSGDHHALVMVQKTLDAMAAGGIYDQIGGGFARYSTDQRWLVPHFEKMLYDNALLARTYVEAFQATGDDRYRVVACETLDYILREMVSPEGGFYSATDADSEGVEGKFFVWTPDEVRAALPTEEDARRVCAYYDITAGGNWEHKSIPHRPHTVEEVARDLRISAAELQSTLDRCRPVLYETRSTRVPPGLDDKILTAWNGMMISAMAEGGRILGKSRYLLAAQEAADFLLRTLSRPDGGLYRTYRAGKAHLNAYLEDYAYLAEALVDLYEAGGHEGYVTEAVRLAERIVADFSDTEHGGFFTTAKDHENLIVRGREGPDGATPSGNAVAASALARLSFHFAREDFRESAVAAVRAYGRQIARYPKAFAKSLAVADLLLRGPVEVAVVGCAGDPAYEALRAEVNGTYLPNRVLAHADPLGPSSQHPLLSGKGLMNDAAAVYVCRNFACQAPVTAAALVKHALQQQGAGHTTDTASAHRTLQGTRLAGKATAGDTASYAVRFVNRSPSSRGGPVGYTALGSTGLTTSRLGFGGYRIEWEDPSHREALAKAFSSGWNLVDTSTNYTDGSSERLIGRVLAESMANGHIGRAETIVVSKIGYVQGQNLKRAEARERSGRPYPQVVKYGEGIWHCIHPEFLADQLELSLDRLGLETLDVCLLHNPEYFLSDAKQRGIGDLAAWRTEFYARLQEAFGFLERQVVAGRLQFYGVSSNTCTAHPDDPEATSLGRMLESAEAAAQRLGIESHHFNVLQLPMNIYESGAVLQPNTGPEQRRTVLELAQERGIAVLVNRPLNAIPGSHSAIVRLADVPVEPSGIPFEDQREKIVRLEEEYRREIAPQVLSQGQGLPPAEYFRWAEELARVRPRVQGLEHWDQIENQMVAPHLHEILRVLNRQLTGQEAGRWQDWRDRYLPELLTLLKGMRGEAAGESKARAASIAAHLDPLLPETRRNQSLSRKALWVLASTAGVACVLNGARTPAYVEDSGEILAWEPLSDTRRVYQVMQPKS